MAKTDERPGGGAGGTDEQRRNALTIISVGQQLGISSQGILIALMAGYAESGLHNVNYGDRDSLGIFQQRGAWGSSAQRLNVAESARMFFTGGHGGQRGLLDIRGWDTMDPGRAAQKVQVSAYPDRYNQFRDTAGDLLARLGGGSTDSGMNPNSTGGSTGGGTDPISSPGEQAWTPVATDLTGKPGAPKAPEAPVPNFSDPLSSAMEKLLESVPGGKSRGGGGYASVVSSPDSPALSAGNGPVQSAASATPAAFKQQADYSAMLASFGGAPDAGTKGLRSAVINNARKALGVPYKYGGNDMATGVDCSSLLQLAMRQAGINIPRLAHYQALAGNSTRVNNKAAYTRSMKPGDFIFWGQINHSGDGHIAMYLGNGQIIEAPRTGLTVRVRNLYDGDFTQRPTYAVSMAKFYGESASA